ncbi:hypothetical protein Glove_492g19 [Diversispora epigaea]|uniref:Uncharacterized protein n=1 Tax=Diversispora epigaea TaxID=1348612 RepID=A0A397GP23_9GLOM|nr:hypothetical protein Glove_492g19 [Diversispora epigaea]
MGLRSDSSLDGVSSCIQLPNTPDLARECTSLVSDLVKEFWINTISSQKQKIETLAERSVIMEELTTNTMRSTLQSDIQEHNVRNIVTKRRVLLIRYLKSVRIFS